MAGARAQPHPHCLRLSLVGTAVWLVWLLMGDVGPVEGLLVLSPLVLHPLVLRLVAYDDEPQALFKITSWAQLPAGIFLASSYFFEPGTTAAMLSLPWAGVCGLTALWGLLRIRGRGLRPTWALVADGGLLFIAVGGAWVVTSRLGARPLAFSDTIVLLTGVHFHYAGFVLPVLAGLTARRLAHRAFDLAGWGVLAAVPLTAIGITASPTVEVIGALTVAMSGVTVAIGQLLLARASEHRLESLLWALSSLSLMFAMSLAAIYGVGEFRGLPWPTIPEMARLHGTLNALGTCLLGVWAWTLRGPSDP